MRILKTEAGDREPLLTAVGLHVSLLWGQLVRGRLVTNVRLESPELTYIAPPVTPRRGGEGKEKSPQETLLQLFPFKVSQFQISHGRIHFINHYASPPISVTATKISVLATNLTNIPDLKVKLPAGVNASGETLGGGFDVQMQLNPLMNQPTLQLNAQLTNVHLIQLNDFLRAYGKVDVERGTFSLFASFAAAEGNYDGYAKVFFTDLRVFDWQKERHKNILEIFWAAIVESVSNVLSNQPKNQLAAKIPLSGSFQAADIDVWTAAGTLLQNAFIRALIPRLDEASTMRGLPEGEAK